jgi:hypothetical protein
VICDNCEKEGGSNSCFTSVLIAFASITAGGVSFEVDEKEEEDGTSLISILFSSFTVISVVFLLIAREIVAENSNLNSRFLLFSAVVIARKTEIEIEIKNSARNKAGMCWYCVFVDVSILHLNYGAYVS